MTTFREMFTPEAVRETLREHWLTGVGCNKEAQTNTPTCSCSMWSAPTFNSVGEAIDAWIEHVIAKLDRR